MRIVSYRSEMIDYYTKEHNNLFGGEVSLTLLDRKNPCVNDGEVFIGGQMSSDQLALFPKLKMIIVPYTGLDGLDLVALDQAGVRVLNTSAHGIFVAERAVALLLSLRGQIVQLHNNLVKGNWSKRFVDYKDAWHSTYKKKIAIYGYGTIGQEIGRLLEGFGGELGVLAYKDRDFSPARTFDDLESLCDWCDILMVAAPLTDQTKHSVDGPILSKMDGKYIVNVGRGAIIEEEAIYKSLVDGGLGGFASDVWYTYPSKTVTECPPSNYPIHELDNVVMTPHNAGFEVGAAMVRYEDVLKQVMAFISEERK